MPQSTPSLDLIILGCVGGLIPDILRIIRGRYRSKFPKYFYSGTFWLGLIFLVALGAFASWLLGAQHAKEALAYGFAGPELVSRFFAESAGPVDRGDIPFKLRDWWTA